MLRFLSKKKAPSYFFKGVNSTPLLARSFNDHATNPLWAQLSEKDRIDYALAARKPENAEVAFYRGLGFKAIGTEHAGAAIAAFEIAAKMNPKYSPASKMEIAFIYAKVGQLAEAHKNLDSACRELIKIATQGKEKAGSKAIMDAMEAIAHIPEEAQVDTPTGSVEEPAKILNLS